MKRRELSRQIAVQALYQLDLSGEEPGPDLVEFLRESTKDPEVYFFARQLTEEAWAWREEADRLVARAAEHWDLGRMAVLDRNILRLAAYELACCPDVPQRVIIDQAIALAKRFSSAESGAFVNGILDRVLKMLEEERGRPREAVGDESA